MISLVKNELVKIFSKRSLYIKLAIILIFIVLTTCIYKFAVNSFNEVMYAESTYYEETQKRLKELEDNKETNTEEYVYIKTELEIRDISKQYANQTWKNEVIENQGYNIVYDINNLKYIEGQNEKDSREIKELINKKNALLEKLINDDWRYFVQERLNESKQEKEQSEVALKQTTNPNTIQQLKTAINSAEIEIQANEYRLKYNISYDRSYLDYAINDYIASANAIYQYENSAEQEKSEFENKQMYQNNVKTYNISKYKIENQIDVDKMDDTKGLLTSIYDEYSIFIILMVIIIAAGIVSEEFNKGTIKLLLVRPYSRIKILMSKYIAALLIIPITIIFIIIMQLIVGGIFFGLDCLQNPVVTYDYNQNTLVTMNVFKYIGLQTLYMLPLLVLLTTIAFALSSLITNTSLALAGPLLLYMGGSILNMLAQVYKLDWLRYFITLNWDVKQYMFGALPETPYTTMPFSLVICAIYFVVIMGITVVNFKRKNVKNI